MLEFSYSRTSCSAIPCPYNLAGVFVQSHIVPCFRSCLLCTFQVARRGSNRKPGQHARRTLAYPFAAFPRLSPRRPFALLGLCTLSQRSLSLRAASPPWGCMLFFITSPLRLPLRRLALSVRGPIAAGPFAGGYSYIARRLGLCSSSPSVSWQSNGGPIANVNDYFQGFLPLPCGGRWSGGNLGLPWVNHP